MKLQEQPNGSGFVTLPKAFLFAMQWSKGDDIVANIDFKEGKIILENKSKKN